MATNDDSVTYMLLTPADELTILTNQLRNAETQHYQLSLNMLGQPDGSANPQLDTITAQVKALQADYTAVKAAADAEAAKAAPA